jgi:hypothetical protein
VESSADPLSAPRLWWARRLWSPMAWDVAVTGARTGGKTARTAGTTAGTGADPTPDCRAGRAPGPAVGGGCTWSGRGCSSDPEFVRNIGGVPEPPLTSLDEQNEESA